MNIFVGNMPKEADQNSLKFLFENYGKVNSVTILIDKIQYKWQAFGFIDMPNQEEAEAAIDALDGFIYMGHPLTVHTARFRAKDRRKFGRFGGRRTSDLPEITSPVDFEYYTMKRLEKSDTEENELND